MNQFTVCFNTEYNLAFHKPMNDQCDLCKSYQNSGRDEKALLHYVNNSHMSNKKAPRACKDLDKSKAKAADINFVAACFDLKEVLLTSHRLESVLYYERELNTFNFTVYNMRIKDEYCYVWNETIAWNGASLTSFLSSSFTKTLSKSTGGI